MKKGSLTKFTFLKLFNTAISVALLSGCAISVQEGKDENKINSRPNFIVIFTDDQGYQDLGCFGSSNIRTPNLDRIAKEGMKFTSFYAQTVCGPSRAALMTGCYPLRVAKRNNDQVSIHPFLHTKEITVAEVLKEVDYATACFGKWDLAGHTQKHYDELLLPTRQGFDYYFGTPTSNDAVVKLLHNEILVEQEADMANLTQRYTNEALEFIRKNMKTPFFVYIPYTMPHILLAASEQFRGKSPRGLYGDVIEEIDFNVGRVIQELKTLELEKNTYVIFISDNGPWFMDRHPNLSELRDEGGSYGGDATPLRGHKTSTWEGGVRVPCIMWAPGRIPAGKECSEIATTMDILPTLASLAGGSAPADRVIDGKDISDLIYCRAGARSPTKAFYYYAHTQLMAVRAGRWKLHLPRKVNTMQEWNIFQKESDVLDFSEPHLYDLEKDPGERQNVAQDHPDMVKQLTGLADWARDDIGDYDRIGRNARFFDAGPRRPDITK